MRFMNLYFKVFMKIKVKIIKSARRTISLTVNKDAELVARVPLNYDKAQLDAFIIEKSKWVIKYVKEMQANKEKYAEFKIRNGAKLILLEQEYSIVIKPTKQAKILDFNIILPVENSKEKLITLIKKFAKEYLSRRVKELALQFGFSYNSIKIGGAKTVWGSCSSKNNLNFTYKLMLTPYFVVDYIIIHELSHTKVRNHSRKFYQTIAKSMPNYKQAEIWLKQNKGIINYL